MDAGGLEVVDGLARRAPRTVKASDARAVSRSRVIDELGEPGAVRTLSGHDVGEHPDRAGVLRVRGARAYVRRALGLRLF